MKSNELANGAMNRHFDDIQQELTRFKTDMNKKYTHICDRKRNIAGSVCLVFIMVSLALSLALILTRLTRKYDVFHNAALGHNKLIFAVVTFGMLVPAACFVCFSNHLNGRIKSFELRCERHKTFLFGGAVRGTNITERARSEHLSYQDDGNQVSSNSVWGVNNQDDFKSSLFYKVLSWGEESKAEEKAQTSKSHDNSNDVDYNDKCERELARIVTRKLLAEQDPVESTTSNSQIETDLKKTCQPIRTNLKSIIEDVDGGNLDWRNSGHLFNNFGLNNVVKMTLTNTVTHQFYDINTVNRLFEIKEEL